MAYQGDVEIIHNWREEHSVEDLQRIVERKGYSAISVGSFDHAALKKFPYQLTAGHCEPSPGYSNTFYIWRGRGGGGGSGKPGNDAPGRFSFANLFGWAGGGSGKSGGGAVLGNDLSGRWFSFARADGRPNGDRYEFRREGDVYKIYRNGHHNDNDQFTFDGATGLHAHGPTFTLQANGDLHWDLDGGKWGSRKERWRRRRRRRPAPAPRAHDRGDRGAPRGRAHAGAGDRGAARGAA